MLSIFRVLNTNRKRNDLTSWCRKGLRLSGIARSAVWCGIGSTGLECLCFPQRTHRQFPGFLGSCVQGLEGGQMGPRRADSDHYALNDISLKAFKIFFKTTKAFSVISLNVYFFKNANL